MSDEPAAADLNAGGFRPVADEVYETDLPVRGEIPADLNGRWLRNGPNPHSMSFDGNDYFSWFLGDGMVHGIHLEGGRALSYRNRYVRTKALAAKEGAEVDPDTPSNTNVIPLGSKLLSLCETGVPYEITTELETVGPQDFGGSLPGGTMSAHPKFDAHTGETLAFDYNWQEPYGRYWVFDSDGEITHETTLDVSGPVMMHDFAVTQSYSVFMDLPVVFDLEMAMAGMTIPYRWQDDHQARIGVIPRHGDTVQWFDIDPCFVFHTMNAYETADTVVLDAVRYDRLLSYDLPSRTWSDMFNPGYLTRFELNLTTGVASQTEVAEVNVEFPRVADLAVGRPYQHGYSVEFQPDLVNSRGLARFDLESGAVERWEHAPGDLVGEPLFVPRQGAAPGTEDDGYVIYPIYRAAEDRSALEIRAAGELNGPAIGSVELPCRIPAGFHGNWVGL